MQKKRWFVSCMITSDDQKPVTTHAFIEGDTMDEALEAYLAETKRSLSGENEELTLLSVKQV